MPEKYSRINRNHLSGWIKYNLAGWGCGILIGFILGQILKIPIEYSLSSDMLYNYHLEPIFTGIFSWLPFGICIGVAQQLQLKQWRIRANGWVLATTLGWGLSGTALAYTNDYFLRQNSPSPWRFYVTVATITLIGGITLGAFQSVVIRKILRRIDLWVLANALGLPVLGLILFGIVSLAFALKSIFLNFFYSYNLSALADARDYLLLGFILFSMPFLGILTLFLPTGKILLKYTVSVEDNGESLNSKVG